MNLDTTVKESIIHIYLKILAIEKNIVLTSKEYRKEHKRIKKNVKLYKNPNPNNDKQSYLIPIIYNDSVESFDGRKLKWEFHPNDKRKVKRLKKRGKV